MSTYTHIVRCCCIKSIDELNRIIEHGDESWPGLNTAEAIISMQWEPETEMYIVFWRERKWLNSDAAAAEHS